MNMKEAYLKVLGLDQKPLEESKVAAERAAWVPASIAEGQVEAFMEAVKSALAEKQDVVQFEGKKWKVSEKKSCATEGSMKDDDEEEEGDEDKEIEGGDDEIIPSSKKSVKEDKYAELIATLSEGGLPQEEIDSIVARLEEKAAPQEMGDNLSDGELDFIDTHEVEVIDGTPEKPDFDKDLDKAEEPKAQGAAKVEVDGKKAAEKQPVTTTKAAVPTTK